MVWENLRGGSILDSLQRSRTGYKGLRAGCRGLEQDSEEGLAGVQVVDNEMPKWAPGRWVPGLLFCLLMNRWLMYWCRTEGTFSSCCNVKVYTGEINNRLPAQTRWLIPPLFHFSRSPPFPQPRSNTDTCWDPVPRTCSRISPVSEITNIQSTVQILGVLFSKKWWIITTPTVVYWQHLLWITDAQTHSFNYWLVTDENTLQPVVEVPHEENSALTSNSQTDFL